MTDGTGTGVDDLVEPSYDLMGRYTGRSINNTGTTTLVYDEYGRRSTVTNPRGRSFFITPLVPLV